MAAWADVANSFVGVLQNRSVADIIVIFVACLLLAAALAFGFGLVSLEAYATEKYVNNRMSPLETKIDTLTSNQKALKGVVDANTRGIHSNLLSSYQSQLLDLCGRVRSAVTDGDKAYYEGELARVKELYTDATDRPWQGPPGC